MADNVIFQTGAIASPPDGLSVSTDEGAGGHVQRMKLAYSDNGSETHVQADDDGLLVNLGSNNDVSINGTVTVDGSGVTQPVSGTVTVQDGGGSITVDGTVGVTGTFWQATQPVSGTVTVEDGSGSITVDNAGTFAVQAAQSGTWTVQPGNTANTTAWKVDASSVAVPITDNSGSLTVDGTVTIQDGGGSITVDGTVSTSTPIGSSSLANGQVSATNAAGTLVSSRAGRTRLTMTNMGGTTVYIGVATVTTANGFPLDPGASIDLATTVLVQGITASGSSTIAYIEEY